MNLSFPHMLDAEAFRDQVALVIGPPTLRPLIDRFRACGAQVVFAGLDGAEVHLADTSDPQLLVELFERIEGEFGPPSLLIHAVDERPATALVEEASMRDVLTQHLDAAFFASAEFARRCMARQAAGQILLLVSADAARPGHAVEAAARGAIENLIKSLAVEWARDGLRINAVARARGGVLVPADVWPMLYLCTPQASYITGHLLVLDVDEG